MRCKQTQGLGPMNFHSITIDHYRHSAHAKHHDVRSKLVRDPGYCSCMFNQLTSKLHGPGCLAISVRDHIEPLWAEMVQKECAGIKYHHPAYPNPKSPQTHVGFKAPWWRPWILQEVLRISVLCWACIEKAWVKSGLKENKLWGTIAFI